MYNNIDFDFSTEDSFYNEIQILEITSKSERVTLHLEKAILLNRAIFKQTLLQSLVIRMLTQVRLYLTVIKVFYNVFAVYVCMCIRVYKTLRVYMCDDPSHVQKHRHCEHASAKHRLVALCKVSNVPALYQSTSFLSFNESLSLR